MYFGELHKTYGKWPRPPIYGKFQMFFTNTFWKLPLYSNKNNHIIWDKMPYDYVIVVTYNATCSSWQIATMDGCMTGRDPATHITCHWFAWHHDIIIICLLKLSRHHGWTLPIYMVVSQLFRNRHQVSRHVAAASVIRSTAESLMVFLYKHFSMNSMKFGMNLVDFFPQQNPDA